MSALLIPGLVLTSILLLILHILFSLAMSRRSKGKVWVIALRATLLSIVLWFTCTMLWIRYYEAHNTIRMYPTLRLGDTAVSNLMNAEGVFDGTLGLPYYQPATLLASLGVSQGLLVPVSLLVWGSFLFGMGLLVAVIDRHEKRIDDNGSKVVGVGTGMVSL